MILSVSCVDSPDFKVKNIREATGTHRQKIQRIAFIDSETPSSNFNHEIHAGRLGLDCRTCHVAVEKGQKAGLPSSESCMGCHAYVRKDDPKLQFVRESWINNESIVWQISNDIPDHAKFHHGKHIQAGMKCITCHGDVSKMEIVEKQQEFSMQWCLECHKNPHQAVTYQLNIPKYDALKSESARTCYQCHY